jgi:uncharacterized protein (DUF1697 family)
MTKIAAFLRGINLNGKTVKMAELKTVLEKLKLKKVKTLLASGNVIFESEESPEILKPLIEDALEKKFGWHIEVILRTYAQLQKLKDSQPFKGITVKPITRLYVTFLVDKPTVKLQMPHQPNADLTILALSPTEICSVLELNEGSRSVDAMNFIEKTFGKNVTTRNWNTIEKVLKA